MQDIHFLMIICTLFFCFGYTIVRLHQEIEKTNERMNRMYRMIVEEYE